MTKKILRQKGDFMNIYLTQTLAPENTHGFGFGLGRAGPTQRSMNPAQTQIRGYSMVQMSDLIHQLIVFDEITMKHGPIEYFEQFSTSSIHMSSAEWSTDAAEFIPHLVHNHILDI
jgi:hypothetical protein